MSVSISGPQGYEYQYLVSTYLVLLYIKEEKISEAYIERINREDLALTYSSGKFCDFQFKDRINQLDIKTFAECLLKFDAKKSDSNILSKLGNDPQEAYYLVTSARAGEFAAALGILLKDASLIDKVSNSSFDKGIYNSLLDEISKIYNKANTNLDKQRKAFVNSQYNHFIASGELEKLLKKVHIIENLTTDYIENRISYILGKMEIPFSQHHLLRYRLIELLKNTRGKNKNIVNLFKQLIGKSKGNVPLVQQSYQKTGQESSLFDYLNKYRYLLLTGSSLCGKSQMAVFLANLMFDNYSDLACKVTFEFSDAQSFLLDNSSETRVCILEDPFGQDFAQIGEYKKIENLVQHIEMRSGKYLIVTSNKKVLLTAVNEFIINNNWHDITVLNQDFLLKLWKIFASEDISQKLFRAVSDLINNSHPELLPQPGQLNYLAKNGMMLRTITPDSIRMFANPNSETIERQITDLGQDVIELMIKMAISSNCIEGVSDLDLRYLMDNDDDYLPGINSKDNFLGSKSFGGRGKKPKLGEYRPLKELDKTVIRSIEKTIDNGYILQREHTFLFCHPIYEFGAKRLLNATKNSFRRDKILVHLKKSIGSLNLTVAHNSIKNLYIIGDFYEEDIETLKQLIGIAEIALKSTFVIVRSSALQFLVKYIYLVSDDTIKIIEHEIRNKELTTYQWHEGIAYIPNQSHFSAEVIFSDMIASKSADNIWVKYQKTDEKLSPHNAIITLKFLIDITRHQKGRVNLPLNKMIPFIYYFENFIIEKASYLIAASLNDDNYEEFSWILIEDRPLIKFELIKGLIRAWPYFLNVETAEKVFLKMEELLNDRFVALASIDLFTQYNSGHSRNSFDWRNEIEQFAIEKMWNLWGKLSPTLVKNLPPNFSFHDGRFSDAIIHAKVTDIKTVYEMINSWSIWLKNHFIGRLVYETHISQCVLQMFEKDFERFNIEQRQILTLNLLKLKNKHFHARLFRIIIKNWENLSKEEKRFLEDQILKEPIQQKAIILTTEDCPSEIIISITGLNEFNQKSPKWIVDNFDNDMLQTILVLTYKYAPTASLPYMNYLFWNPVLAKLLTLPEKESFLIAVEVYIKYFLNYNPIGFCKWPKSSEIFKFLNTSVNTNLIEVVFKIIINCLSFSTNRGEILLTKFFNNIDVDKKAKCGFLLQKYIEKISHEDNFDSISNYLMKEYILGFVSKDVAVRTAMNIDKKYPENEDIKNNVSRLIVDVIHNKSIRLQHIILEIRDWERENKFLFSTQEIDEIENYLNYFFEIADKQSEELVTIVESNFQNWYLE